MRISVLIYIFIVLTSSTKPPEEKFQSLNENWVENDINLISEESMGIRFDKALENAQTQRPYFGSRLEDRLELKMNTLKEKKVHFKTPDNPLKPSSLIVTFPLQ